MLSYSSRSASAARLRWVFRAVRWAMSGAASRRSRFPPKIRRGRAKNSREPATVSRRSVWANSSREVSMAAAAPEKKASAAMLRRLHFAAHSPATP